MKIKHILFLAVAASLGSCSTAYRTGQTPDDVYYSPAPVQKNYVAQERQEQQYSEEEDAYIVPESEQDRNSYSYRNEDQQIRRGIENPIYRNSITFSMGMGYGYNPYSLFPYNTFNNPFYYGNDPFAYNGYGYSPYGMKGMYNPYYNPYAFNNFGYYSPYNMYSYSPYGFGYSPFYSSYAPIYFSHGSKTNTNTGARRYNLNAYSNNGKTANPVSRGSQPIRTIETTAPSRTTGVGNVIRRVFTPSERNSYTPSSNNRSVRRSSSNNNTRSYNNTRTYDNNRSNNNETRSFEPRNTPSVSTPAPSSNRSSSSSSSAPVRTFKR